MSKNNKATVPDLFRKPAGEAGHNREAGFASSWRLISSAWEAIWAAVVGKMKCRVICDQ
jgi:hypothetical protein